MYTRPVGNAITKALGLTHSYWDIKEVDPNTGGTVDLNEVISGDKQFTGLGAGTDNPLYWLNMNIHAPTNAPLGPGVPPYLGNETTNNPSGKISFDSGLSNSNCMSVVSMYTLASNWPNNTVPYNGLTSNSNTVAHPFGLSRRIFGTAAEWGFGPGVVVVFG